MNLHKDKAIFQQALEDTAKHMGFSDTSIAEKDYFATYFLQKITEKQPGMIFKGGTSLSKCHKIINRFSEDIDLNVDTESSKLTEGRSLHQILSHKSDESGKPCL